MATKIRLKRIGRKNKPFYRMVVIDSRRKRDGAPIEQLGWYNPIGVEKSCELNSDRIIHWLKEGAQPTDAAQKLFKKKGISYKWHLIQSGLDEPAIEKELKKWELDKEAARNKKNKSTSEISKISQSSTKKEEPKKEEPKKEEVKKEEPKKEEVKKEEPKKEKPKKEEPKKEVVKETKEMKKGKKLSEDKDEKKKAKTKK